MHGRGADHRPRREGSAGHCQPPEARRDTEPASPLTLGRFSWSPQAGIVTARACTGQPLGWPRRPPARPLSGSELSSLLRDSGPEGPGRSLAVPWARVLHESKETWWSPMPTCRVRAAERCLNSSWLQEEFKGDPNPREGCLKVRWGFFFRPHSALRVP